MFRTNFTKIDKDVNVSVVTVSYKIKFIDSVKFMMSSLSILSIISQKEFTELNEKNVF